MSEAIVELEHFQKEFDGTVAVADLSVGIRYGESCDPELYGYTFRTWPGWSVGSAARTLEISGSV